MSVFFQFHCENTHGLSVPFSLMEAFSFPLLLCSRANRFMGTRNNFPSEAWGFAGGNSIGFGGGSLELCLVPKKEIVNFQSRWLNVRRMHC